MNIRKASKLVQDSLSGPNWWDKWRPVVKELKPDWCEDIDEAEDEFMGWRRVKTNHIVRLKAFSDWAIDLFLTGQWPFKEPSKDIDTVP